MSLYLQGQESYLAPNLTSSYAAEEYPKIVDVSTDPKSDETYIKMYMMDDRINKNFWQIPDKVMKKYATSFINRPWVIHPSGDHPNYIKEGVVHDSPTFIEDVLNVQDRYKAGDIIDVTHEPLKHDPSRKAWFATVRVTNKEIMKKIKSGSIPPYVSPQIFDLSKALPNEPTTEFIPLHVATVNEPAYGNIARIRAVCNGSGATCINRLKSAAATLNTLVSNGFTQQQIDNSSFLKNLPENINRLTNPNNYQQHYQQQYIDPNTNQPTVAVANNGFNPFAPANAVDSNGQFLSQKTQIQEVDANGNIVTRTEDKKPRNKQGQIIATPEQTPVPQPQPQPQQQPGQPPNQAPTADVVIQPNQAPAPQGQFQLPTELLETLKGLQASQQGITERLNQIEQFKKSAEDEKIKKASEAQRQIIESVFTPEVIQDEAAREDVINYFVGLPLSDEDLQKILDMIVTGTFNSAQTGGAADQKQASKPNNVQNKKKGTVKQASLNLQRLSLQQEPETYFPVSGSAVKRIFGDIDFGNIR